MSEEAKVSPTFIIRENEKKTNIDVFFKDGEPKHICHLRVDQKPMPHDYILVKDLTSYQGSRKTVLVSELWLPKNILREHQTNINLIKNALMKCKQKHKLGDVSAHKKLSTEIVKGNFENIPPNVRVCIHRLGPVVSYFLGHSKNGEFSICVHPHIIETEIDVNGKFGLLVRLKSYDELEIADILSQYLAEAVYYLESIFRAGSPEIIIRYCRKIREVLGESFDSKINDIKEGLKSNDEEIRNVAMALWEKNEARLRVLIFCREFIQLIVNYIYSFLHFSPKLEYYRDKLDRIISKEKDADLPFRDYALLLRTYQQLEQNEDIKIPETDAVEEWVRTLILVSRKVQLIKRAISNYNVDFSKVNIFLSHHMNCPNSLYFSREFKKFIQENYGHVNVVLGYTEHQEWVHDTVETLIWLSDMLVVYFPAVCNDFFGKRIENHEWIIKEIMLAKMLDRHVVFIFEKPSSFDLDEFLSQLNRYVESTSKSLPESYKSKLIKCARELKVEIYMKYRVEYTPSYRFDEKISKEITAFVNDISKKKCLMFLKMIRLWFKKRTWYVIRHIHRVSKYGYITDARVISTLLKDKRTPYKDKTGQQLQRIIIRVKQKCKNPIINIDSKWHSLIEIKNKRYFRSNLNGIMLLIQQRYNITEDLTPIMDSFIDKSDILA